MNSSILESGRIILRPFEWKDLDDVYEYLSVFTEHAFVEMKLNRVEATHYVGNEGSGRVMQKCGMKYEGTGMSEVKIKGVYRDVVHYAILKWRSK